LAGRASQGAIWIQDDADFDGDDFTAARKSSAKGRAAVDEFKKGET